MSHLGEISEEQAEVRALSLQLLGQKPETLFALTYRRGALAGLHQLAKNLWGDEVSQELLPEALAFLAVPEFGRKIPEIESVIFGAMGSILRTGITADSYTAFACTNGGLSLLADFAVNLYGEEEAHRRFGPLFVALERIDAIFERFANENRSVQGV